MSKVRRTATTTRAHADVYVSMTDFGGKLRLAREQHGVSLGQMAATTKISVAALEALERNDISKLPGGIFSRGFVRSYATEVGLDPDETVREFLERFQPGTTTARPRSAAPPARQVRRTPAVTPRREPFASDEAEFESRQRMVRVVLKLVLISVPLAGFILYFTLGRGSAR